MDFSDPRLIVLLRDVNRAKQEHELTARLTGANFNIFNILRLSTAEVRAHSAFIAELLNPKGSHGQGTVYLELFLERLSDVESITNGKEPAKIDAFQAEGAKVDVEIAIGRVNREDSTGGRIDILLTDVHGSHIVIENKIYAGDQADQLLRYNNFCKEKPSATLFYLTLPGDHPDPLSTGGESFPYTCLSYKEHIRRWLDDCHRASVSLPVVRESIFQYKCLIQQLTNQATGDKVKEDVKRIILDNPDLADAVPVLWEAWQSILFTVRTNFDQHTKEIDQHLDAVDGSVIIRARPLDCGGFVVAFRAERGGKPVGGDEASRYANVLNGLVRFYGRDRGGGYWNVGWFTPDPFGGMGGGIDSIPKRKILSLYENPSAMAEFASTILKQSHEVTDKLLAGIAALK
jgi:hypothetical protein